MGECGEDDDEVLKISESLLRISKSLDVLPAPFILGVGIGRSFVKSDGDQTAHLCCNVRKSLDDERTCSDD